MIHGPWFTKLADSFTQPSTNLELTIRAWGIAALIVAGAGLTARYLF